MSKVAEFMKVSSKAEEFAKVRDEARKKAAQAMEEMENVRPRFKGKRCSAYLDHHGNISIEEGGNLDVADAAAFGQWLQEVYGPFPPDAPTVGEQDAD